MQKNLIATFTLAAALLCATVASAQDNPINTDKTATAKIVQMLEASSQVYTKAKDGVWVVKFKGKQLADIGVVAFSIQDMLIFVVSVAEKAEFKTSPDLLMKLLNLNDQFDRLKIGIDGDGDLFTRIDLSLRLIDQKEFNANLEQISAGADELYGHIKPFLLTSKKAAK